MMCLKIWIFGNRKWISWKVVFGLLKIEYKVRRPLKTLTISEKDLDVTFQWFFKKQNCVIVHKFLAETIKITQQRMLPQIVKSICSKCVSPLRCQAYAFAFLLLRADQTTCPVLTIYQNKEIYIPRLQKGTCSLLHALVSLNFKKQKTRHKTKGGHILSATSAFRNFTTGVSCL